MPHRRGPGGRGLLALLMGVLVLAILARLALPLYQTMALRTLADQAANDIRTARLAALSYNEETGEWPADSPPGVVPPQLETHTDGALVFERGEYTLDWNAWVLPDGLPGSAAAPPVSGTDPPGSGTALLLGVSLATDDATLGRAVMERVEDALARYSIEGYYTFIISAN